MAKSPEQVAELMTWARGRVQELGAKQKAGDVQKGQPTVIVTPAPVTVIPAPAYDWEHTHQYDGAGRLVKTISRRVPAKKTE